MRLRRESDLTTAGCAICGWSQSVYPEFADDLAAALRNHVCRPELPVSRREVIELRDALTRWIDATEGAAQPEDTQ